MAAAPPAVLALHYSSVIWWAIAARWFPRAAYADLAAIAAPGAQLMSAAAAPDRPPHVTHGLRAQIDRCRLPAPPRPYRTKRSLYRALQVSVEIGTGVCGRDLNMQVNLAIFRYLYWSNTRIRVQ